MYAGRSIFASALASITTRPHSSVITRSPSSSFPVLVRRSTLKPCSRKPFRSSTSQDAPLALLRRARLVASDVIERHLPVRAKEGPNRLPLLGVLVGSLGGVHDAFHRAHLDIRPALDDRVAPDSLLYDGDVVAEVRLAISDFVRRPVRQLRGTVLHKVFVSVPCHLQPPSQ